jgi:hypothetical protein
MKRNKQFYENKKMLRLSREYNKAQNEFNEKIKKWGKWNGYEFYLSPNNYSKDHGFYKDLQDCLPYACEKQFQCVHRTYWGDPPTDEDIKIFKGEIDDLLKTYATEEGFIKSVPLKFRHFFKPIHTSDYSFKEHKFIRYIKWWKLDPYYYKYLEIKRKRHWQKAWIYAPYHDSKTVVYKNKIDKNNLWPKINRAQSRSVKYKDDYDCPKRIRKEKIIKKQLSNELYYVEDEHDI